MEYIINSLRYLSNKNTGYSTDEWKGLVSLPVKDWQARETRGL